MSKIPFNKPYTPNNAVKNIESSLSQMTLENNYWTKEAQTNLTELTQAKHVLLTNSCTQALELASLLANINPGDEVIIPSFTFVSTANAFVLRGAIPIFVDINPKTLNIDIDNLESIVTQKTKAIVPVHYAAVSCQMNLLNRFAKENNLFVIEDAAQCINAYQDDSHLGSLGKLGTLSFHHTKNIHTGLGGALLINDESLIDRARILWQKGTNRDAFINGKVDKYTWVDLGSSFIASEIMAALLCAQLDELQQQTNHRLAIWNQYHNALEELEQKNMLRRPVVPANAKHNAHMYYLILNSASEREQFINYMASKNIQTTSHYEPLHLSPAGKEFGYHPKSLPVTEKLSQCLVRLPLYTELSQENASRVIEAIFSWSKQRTV